MLPVIIESWNTWNAQGEITQYDASTRAEAQPCAGEPIIPRPPGLMDWHPQPGRITDEPQHRNVVASSWDLIVLELSD